MPGPSIELTGVVACADATSDLAARVAKVLESCAGLRAEVLVVDAVAHVDAAAVARRDPTATVLAAAPGTLVPALWAQGIARASGEAVALTTSEFGVGRAWARAMLAGLAAGAAGVGGPFVLRRGTGPSAAAAFFLRYSAFLGAPAAAQPVREVAGDNATYARGALERHGGTDPRGFWEVEFHRTLRAAGERLAWRDDAATVCLTMPPFSQMLRQRLAHGRHFAAWRVSSKQRGALAVALGAPLVPFVLVTRIARRVARHPHYRAALAGALLPLFALAVAWAVGEALGALAGAPSREAAPLHEAVA